MHYLVYLIQYVLGSYHLCHMYKIYLALVQGRADRVALALSAGPGLAPARFAIGDDVCILPGGLDLSLIHISACCPIR